MLDFSFLENVQIIEILFFFIILDGMYTVPLGKISLVIINPSNYLIVSEAQSADGRIY